MGGMMDKIVKTSFLKRLDQMTALRNAFDLQVVVDDFDPCSGRTTLDLAKDYGVAIDAASESHIRDHWLDPVGGWFRHGRNPEILRRALWEAVKLVQLHDLPIDSYWICHGPDNTRPIEVTLSVNERQVTMILLTPNPPMSADPPVTEPAMWVTHWDGSAVEYRKVKA